VAKPNLGSKRQCPKCDTRFYDLGKDDPVTCVSCGQKFEPEQVLKPRNRPAPQGAPKPVKAVVPETAEDDVDDLVADDDDDDDESADLGTILEIDDDDDEVVIGVDPAVAKDDTN